MAIKPLDVSCPFSFSAMFVLSNVLQSMPYPLHPSPILFKVLWGLLKVGCQVMLQVCPLFLSYHIFHGSQCRDSDSLSHCWSNTFSNFLPPTSTPPQLAKPSWVLLKVQLTHSALPVTCKIPTSLCNCGITWAVDTDTLWNTAPEGLYLVGSAVLTHLLKLRLSWVVFVKPALTFSRAQHGVCQFMEWMGNYEIVMSLVSLMLMLSFLRRGGPFKSSA